MKILITGAGGQLGTELQRATWPDGSALVAPGHSELDISDSAAVARAVGGVDTVINAAAYTKVDDAESNEDLAFLNNAQAPGLLAAACGAAGVPLVHISTDYIFDRQEHVPVQEDEAANPVNVYAASKLAGEEAVRAATKQHLILRVGWLYAAHGQNFLRTMLRLGAEREALSIIDDQYGVPTAARDVAAAISGIISKWRDGESIEFGTFHYAALGTATWFEFAAEIFAAAQKYAYRAPSLTAIETSAYPTPAKRPRYSVLDCRRIEQVYAPLRRPWQDGVGEAVGEILALE